MEEQLHPLQPLSYSGRSRQYPIPCCKVRLEDLRRLYEQLDQKTQEAVDLYLSALNQPVDMTQERFEVLKAQIKQLGHLAVLIDGLRGERIVETNIYALNSDKVPNIIKTITFDSSGSLNLLYNITISNRFRLILDFTEPDIFYNYNPWDIPTPNSSMLEVIGSDTNWVAGVYEQIDEFFKSHATKRDWLHSHVTFSVLHWLMGYPGALWFAYRVDSIFQQDPQSLHTALRGAIYVYLVLLFLLAFRSIIHGLRWVLPHIELKGRKSKWIRPLSYAILVGILTSALYDIIKTLFL